MENIDTKYKFKTLLNQYNYKKTLSFFKIFFHSIIVIILFLIVLDYFVTI